MKTAAILTSGFNCSIGALALILWTDLLPGCAANEAYRNASDYPAAPNAAATEQATGGNAPAEGSIWDYRGVTLFGDAFQNTLMVRHRRLVLIMSESQLDLGPINLNSFNEYEVPPSYFQRAWPAITTMTFRFSPDFDSVTETQIMNYQGRCVAGDCANNVSTLTYKARR